MFVKALDATSHTSYDHECPKGQVLCKSQPSKEIKFLDLE